MTVRVQIHLAVLCAFFGLACGAGTLSSPDGGGVVDGSMSDAGELDGAGSTTDSGGARPDSGGSGTDSGSSRPDARDDEGGTIPPPDGEWHNVTSNLADIKTSTCGNLASIVSKPDEDLLIAGVALHGLWGSKNGGASWFQIATGEVIHSRLVSITWDPGNADRWWVAAIHDGGYGINRTTNNGASFTLLLSQQSADLVSVDFSDPARKLLIAGGHEQGNALFKSTDGGESWPSMYRSSMAGANCTWPLLLDADTYVVGCSPAGESIQRTTNGGDSWTKVSDMGGQGEPLHASDGAIYWGRARGMPGLVRSDNDGASFTKVSDEVATIPLRELPDGRIVTANGAGIRISDDRGVTWQTVAPPPPFAVNAFAYSTFQKAFFASHFTCGSFGADDPVPENAVMRYGWDWEQ